MWAACLVCTRVIWMDGNNVIKPIGRMTARIGDNIRSYHGTIEDAGTSWRILDFKLNSVVEINKSAVLQIIWETQPTPAGPEGRC